MRTISVSSWLWLLWVTIAFITEVVDPFGMDSVADKLSLTVTARLKAPLYASGDIRPVVVLITEESLARRNVPWPPPYRYYKMHDKSANLTWSDPGSSDVWSSCILIGDS